MSGSRGRCRRRRARLGGAAAGPGGRERRPGHPGRWPALRQPGDAGRRARPVAAALAFHPVRAHPPAPGRAALRPALHRRPDRPEPQTTPRVTLTGQAAPVDGPEAAALKARWLARHPYAALYADFADFALWRVRLGGALLVGGFARAVRLRLGGAAARPGGGGGGGGGGGRHHRTRERGPRRCRGGHRGRPARPGPGRHGETWRLVAVDVDGADLAAGERVCRLHFCRPVASAEASGRNSCERRGRAGRQCEPHSYDRTVKEAWPGMIPRLGHAVIAPICAPRNCASRLLPDRHGSRQMPVVWRDSKE